MKKYNANNIKVARMLRKNMTPWERKLWYQFLKPYPVKFYRQRAIGEYVADFYCSKAKLIIEIDGSQHFSNENRLKDDERTLCFEKIGITVLRIPNNEVTNNFDGVCEYIDLKIREKLG